MLIYQYRRVRTAKELGYLQDLLNRGAMKFSRPDEFNDPFDCYPLLWEAPGADEVPHAVVDHMNRNYQVGLSMIHGIACFTPHPDKMLMWSHYGDQHRGVCVGFDLQVLADQVPKNNQGHPLYEPPEPVIYSDARTSVDDTAMYTTKSPEWGYEEEYRLISVKSGGQPEGGPGIWEIPVAAVKQIVLGARMPQSARDEVVRAVGGRFILNVAVLHSKEYRLVIEPLASQPHLNHAIGYVLRPDGIWQATNDESTSA